MTATMKVSIKTAALAEKLDEKIGEMQGYPSTNIAESLKTLMSTGSVEFGWRISCGSTHSTQKMFREWVKVIKSLKSDGFRIGEQNVTHKNRYASNNGGFWNSIIYLATKAGEPCE